LARAYPGCNQFFTGLSGTFHSYNWPTVQLQSKRHNICLRKELGYCGVALNSYSSTSPDTFSVHDSATSTSINDHATVMAISTVHGFVDIPGTPLVSQFSGGKFCEAVAAKCGTEGTITIQNHNYIITHVTLAQGQSGTLGFKMQYNHLPCDKSAGQV